MAALTVDIGAKVTPDVLQQLDQTARAQTRSRADIIRMAIEAYLAPKARFYTTGLDEEIAFAKGILRAVLVDDDEYIEIGRAPEQYANVEEEYAQAKPVRALRAGVTERQAVKQIADVTADTRAEELEEWTAHVLEQARDRRGHFGDDYTAEQEYVIPAGRAVAEKLTYEVEFGSEAAYDAHVAEQERLADEREAARQAEAARIEQVITDAVEPTAEAVLQAMKPGVVYTARDITELITATGVQLPRVHPRTYVRVDITDRVIGVLEGRQDGITEVGRKPRRYSLA